ncbi:hypothetical protein BY458DRAFT_494898 [Sporodiniella umbellata]|nr:hypothetical protein BY458DRAFT_494898 [Sporodiniella umbellata]
MITIDAHRLPGSIRVNGKHSEFTTAATCSMFLNTAKSKQCKIAEYRNDIINAITALRSVLDRIRVEGQQLESSEYVGSSQKTVLLGEGHRRYLTIEYRRLNTTFFWLQPIILTCRVRLPRFCGESTPLARLFFKVFILERLQYAQSSRTLALSSLPTFKLKISVAEPKSKGITKLQPVSVSCDAIVTCRQRNSR